MLEAVVFAAVLVVFQMIGGYIMTMAMMKHFMKKETLKNYTKMTLEVAKELEDEVFD
jgi:hypothetical protein